MFEALSYCSKPFVNSGLPETKVIHYNGRSQVGINPMGYVGSVPNPGTRSRRE